MDTPRVEDLLSLGILGIPLFLLLVTSLLQLRLPLESRPPPRVFSQMAACITAGEKGGKKKKKKRKRKRRASSLRNGVGWGTTLD